MLETLPPFRVAGVVLGVGERMTKQTIWIAIPAYGGTATLGCLVTIARLVASFAARQIPFELKTIDHNGIDEARNILASEFLADENASDLLFVDRDNDFTPELFYRLKNSGKPLIGAAYSYRKIDLSTFYESAKTMSYKAALATASRFTIVRPKDNPTLVVKNGIAKVSGIGMGITLINKSVFTQLAATNKLRKRNLIDTGNSKVDAPLYGFFDLIHTDKQDFKEDISFCIRWQRLCNGEVWAIVDAEPGHVGTFRFSANPSDALPTLQQD